MRRFLTTAVVVCMILAPAASWSASQWLWEADNHTVGTDGKYYSYWTDGINQFIQTTKSGDWDVLWDSPQPGWATIKGGLPNHSGPSGRYIQGASLLGSADPMDPNAYWDVYTGITVAAKVKIPAQDGASGNGNICISVNNPSTVGLKTQGGTTYNSMHAWFGWDEYPTANGENVGINAWNRSGTQLRSWIEPTVPVVGVETIWTISAKRVDTMIVWDLWINGVAQGQDQLGPDGLYHTLCFVRDTDMGTSLRIGQRRTQPFNHESQWDYVGVTNAGVIPGWDGKAPIPEPSSLLALASGFVGLAGVVIRRRR